MNNFAYPYAIFLLALPVLIRYLLPAIKGLHGDALRVPFIKDLQKISVKSGGIWGTVSSNKTSSGLLTLLYLIYALLVIAAARPQWIGDPVRSRSQSRDILLVMDISNSMLQPDFAIGNNRINRLSAVKKVATEFIQKRRDDRMGLILFGTRAYLQAPITYDKRSIQEILWNMDAGMAGDSTSIGDAVGLALKALKDSPNKDEKIIILLTDGENNDGSLSMPEAINLAKNENVKIYTIGVGAETSFVQSFFGMRIGAPNQELDEASLKKLAAETKGNYFRAKDTATLQKIYNIIDKLEPAENNEQYVIETKELFYIPLIGALVLAGILIALSRRR